MDALSLFTDLRIVPVVTIADVEQAVPLASALHHAGIQAIEVTLRTEAALAAIERIASQMPEILVGAGSIRRPAQVSEVQSAGARFAVSPGATATLLRAVRSFGLPFVPGAATASEMLLLLEHGYQLQKFFPAELSGGLSMLKALAAPLPEVRFFPTGGITARLAVDYLDFEPVVCVGGSWFVPSDQLAVGDYREIERLARRALDETINGD